MLKQFFTACWPLLVITVIIVLSAWSIHRHNREAARKGQNPLSFRTGFGRKSFHNDPARPYTEDRRINRNWKP